MKQQTLYTLEKLSSFYRFSEVYIAKILRDNAIKPVKKNKNTYVFEESAVSFLDHFFNIPMAKKEIEVWHIYESRMNYDTSI